MVEVWDPSPELVDLVRRAGWPFEHGDGHLLVRDRTGGRVARALEERVPGQRRTVRPATLEDVFLLRTGRTLRE